MAKRITRLVAPSEGPVTVGSTNSTAEQSNWENIAYFTVVPTAFASVGYVLGWLTGTSDVPVVANLIPSLFGLLAGVIAALLLSRYQWQEAEKQLRFLNDSQRERVHAILEVFAPAELITPRICSFVVIMFCAGCFVGLRRGMHSRVPDYPPINELFRVDVRKLNDRLQPLTLAKLHHFRHLCSVNGMSISDATAVTKSSIIPSLAWFLSGERSPESERELWRSLDDAIAKIFPVKSLEVKKETPEARPEIAPIPAPEA